MKKKKLRIAEKEQKQEKPLIEEFNKYAMSCAIRTKRRKQWQIAPKVIRAYFKNDEITLREKILANQHYVNEMNSNK